MKKTIFLLIMLTAVALTACHSSEKNYREAYEKAVERRKTGIGAETYAKIEAERQRYTHLINGAALDLWRVLIPHFNPDVTAPGVLPMWLRIVYFVLSMVLCSFSIALFFHTYLYPQIYDFFVKGVSAHYHLNRTRFKQCFDASCLLVSCILTLTLFRRFVGIGVGTLIITLCNGWLIGKFSDLFDKALTAEPLFPRFAAHFDLER